MLKRALPLFIFFLFNQFGLTQNLHKKDFNDYKNIFAEGTIPDDFSAKTYAKINDDIKNDKVKLKGNIEKVFLEGVHYSITDLLQSGYVIFGDEVTSYVDKVVGNLLKDDPNLKEELRFYTIKSNETNAFSTFQGIIFVTTGLISQLTNEAQLAFVLSHEIAHYTEKHVVETFDFKVDNQRNSDRIQKLSSFSKEHEFEADKLALNLYNKAGYAISELNTSMDVLLYSYLPFDEREINESFFNDENFTLPSGYYAKNGFSINAEENVDDKKSSHPNIRKRKESLALSTGIYEKWGKEKFIFGEENFSYIRNICRFESVRSDVLDGQFDDAIYSIYCLEKDFPNSIYLERMKAKSWLGLAQNDRPDILSKMPKSKNLEAEIGKLHFTLINLDKKQIIGLALRKVEDIRLKNLNDSIVNLIWKRLIKTIASQEKFDVAKISEKNYKTLLAEYNTLLLDTNKVVEPIKTEVKLSKYDKIKNSKSDPTAILDTASFFYYGLADIKKNVLFNKTYDDFREEILSKEKVKAEFDALTNKEQKKIEDLEEKNKLRTGESALIYVEPQIYCFNSKGINRVKSEKLTENFTNAVDFVANKIDMTVSTISSTSSENFGTKEFNERAILSAYLNEIVEFEDIEVFPTDYNLLQEIQKTYNTDKVMFSILEHEQKLKVSPSVIIPLIFLYPLAIIHISNRLVQTHQTNLKVAVIDLKEGKIKGIESYYYNDPINKYSMKARMYDILLTVKSNPATK